MAVAVALVLAVQSHLGTPARPSIAAGGIGIGVLLAALVIGAQSLVGVALLAFGIEIASGLLLRGGPLDEAAPLEAAALLTIGELAYWSLELRLKVAWPGRMLSRRLAGIAYLVAGGLASATLLELTTAVDVPRGVLLTALGVLGAVGALGLMTGLAASRHA